MLILSNVIAQKTMAWTSIHSWVTNSTVEELLYRLLFFASDIYNISYIHQHDPQRARQIASSKSILTTLVGNNVRLISDASINANYFIHMQHNLMDDWRTTAQAFNALNRNLKELKYSPGPDDPNYRPGESPMGAIVNATDILAFNGYELKSAYMPMPVLSIMCPIFR